MISYFASVQVRQVEPPEWAALEPAGLAFFNVNTPDDLARARQLAG
jgi:molybdopterin-guanine dinucleotide biosynthesis protein A